MAVMSYCWGAKVANLALNNPNNAFKCGVMAHPAMLDPTVVECKQHKHRRCGDATKQTLQTLQNAASGLACVEICLTPSLSSLRQTTADICSFGSKALFVVCIDGLIFCSTP